MTVSDEQEAELIWEMLIMDVAEECGFRHALYKLLDNPRELSEALYKLDYRQSEFKTFEEFIKDYTENRHYWTYGVNLSSEEYLQYLREFHAGLS